MSASDMTDFQRDGELRLRGLSKALGQCVTREVVAGVIPVWSVNEQTVVTLRVGPVKVWLFDDEASYSDSSGAGGGGFEREDYPNGSALLDALVDAVRDILVQHLR